MKKRISCVFLVIICLFTFFTPVLAASQDILGREVSAMTQQILQYIEPEKSLYGFDDIDFDTLYLGDQIPAYELDQSGNAIETDTFYFPIMSGTDWVATSIAFYNDAGKLNVQLSTQYAKKYVNKLSDSNEIALLFDCDSAYVVSDSGINKVAVSPNAVSGMASIESYNNNSQVETAALEGKYTLASENLPVAQGFDTQHALMVPRIKQATGSNQCWAACIASVRGYYGTSTTIKDVYNKIGWDINKDQMATLGNVSSVLEAYGFSLAWKWNGDFNWWELREAICLNERPIFTACSYGVSDSTDKNKELGHAVVIRGFYVNQNISQPGVITYMDPLVGDYIASAVATDGDFEYVPSGSSKHYTMSTFLIVAR